MWRRLLLVLLLTASSLSVTASPASACLCVEAGPAEMIAGHDAAFLGSAAGVRRAGQQDRIWTFEVDRWIKGDLGATVEVSVPASGASCGFELRRGEQAGIFMRLGDGEANDGLCSTLDADALRGHLDPQPVTAATATTVVAGGSGGAHLWLFDDHGNLAASSDDARGDWLVDFNVCPGGKRAVELWEREVVVRHLKTMRAVRSFATPGDLERVWCERGIAVGILASRRVDGLGGRRALVRLNDVDRRLLSGDWVDAEVVGEHLLAAVGRDRTRLQRLSLATGDETLLHRAVDDSGVALGVPPGIEGFAVSPDAERVAFEVTRYPEEGQPDSEAFVYDIGSAQMKASKTLKTEGAEVRWLNDRHLLLTNYAHPPVVLAADDLDILTELPADADWAAVTVGRGTMIGMDGPRLSSVASSTGEITVLATLPAQYTGWVERLPRPPRTKNCRRDHRSGAFG